MHRLTIRGPDGSELSQALTAEKPIVVGRDPTCDVVLPSNLVSRRHLRLSIVRDSVEMEDMGSQNGVYLGGARITGKTEVRPGLAIEVGEFRIQLEKPSGNSLPAPADGVDVSGGQIVTRQLAAIDPGYEPRLLDLAPGRWIVGRDQSAPLQVEHDSVSRRHAELRVLDDGSVTLRDLGSSNGSRVAGQALGAQDEVPLQLGDEVFLGQTRWRLIDPSAPRQSSAQSRRVQTLVAVLALLVVAVAGAWVLRGGSVESAQTETSLDEGSAVDPVADGDAAPDEIETLVSQARSAVDQGMYDRARNLIDQAIEKDPLAQTAKKMRVELESLQQDEKRFAQAVEHFSYGKNTEALETLLQVNPRSRLFAKARLKFQEIADAEMRRSGNECRAASSRRDTRRVLDACTRYLNYRCQGDEDRAALTALRNAESGGRGVKAWSCPPQLAVWFGKTATKVVDVESLLRDKYSDPGQREAVAAYTRDDFDTARRMMAKGKPSPDTRALLEKILQVEGHIRQSRSAVLRGDFAASVEELAPALEADRSLVPAEIESAPRRQIRSDVGQLGYDAGQAQYGKGSYGEAFAVWSRALAFVGQDSRLEEGLQRLESDAIKMLGKSKECSTIRRVLKMTRASPPSPAHREAEALQSECGG